MSTAYTIKLHFTQQEDLLVIKLLFKKMPIKKAGANHQLHKV